MAELVSRAKPYRNWIILVPMGVSGLWFLILELVAPYPRYLLHARADDFIPFLPVFIIPYVIWYFYVAVPGVVLFLKSRDEFVRYAMFITFGMMFACAVYTFWPNGQMLRPDLTGESGVFVGMIRVLYFVDTPTNSAPSIHVTYAVAAHVAITRYNNRRRRFGWVAPVSLVMMTLIIFSTVCIKQHSIIDVLAGLLLSVALYIPIYGRSLSKAVTVPI